MAKAGDTTSTVDWIWLRDALALAAAPFGSEVLAKLRLREWLAAGELPWSCMSWEGPDAEGIARLDRQNRESIVLHIVPSVAYHEGDPQFWRASIKIYWEENGARENATGGARALGIKVSRTHLLALLPEEAREREEALRQTKPAERKLMRPKAWLAEVRKEHPRQQNEPLVAYASRLLAVMQKANVTKVWSSRTLLRRLHDK